MLFFQAMREREREVPNACLSEGPVFLLLDKNACRYVMYLFIRRMHTVSRKTDSNDLKTDRTLIALTLLAVYWLQQSWSKL